MLARLAALLLIVPVAAQGWTDLTPTNPLAGPQGRLFGTMCWDAAHGYTLLFGGYQSPNDTWSFDGTAWTRRNPVTVPGGHSDIEHDAQAMTFHAPGNAVVLVSQGNTYSWDGSNWSLLPVQIGNPANGYPYNIAIGHDATRNQTVLFVGSRQGSSRRDVGETFLWDGFAWTQRPTPTVPYPFERPAMAFDPAAGRLLLATNGPSGVGFFEWNGSNWQQRLMAGAPASVAGMATDAAHNQVVLVDGSMDLLPNHTWTIRNGSCSRLSTPTEPARRFTTHVSADPVRGRIVLFGGCNYSSPGTNSLFLLNDTWEFTAGAAAAYAVYGAGCSGSRGVPSLGAQGGALPRVGQTFQLHVGNLPFAAPTFLFLGLSDSSYGPTPLPFALGGLGAPGCSILASGDQLYALTNVLGNAVWDLPVPALPGLQFFNQAVVFDPAANALGLTTSNGGHATIGF